MKRISSLMLVWALLFSLAVPAAAAELAAGTSLRIRETEGSVTVKDASGGEKTVRSGMRLYSGYTVETAAASAAYISLDETKAVKLDSLTRIEVKKSGKQLEAALSSGQLFFNVTEPLHADERLNIRTSTMVTGVRGTAGWASATQVGILEGEAQVSYPDPGTGETRVERVSGGNMMTYQSTAAPSGGAAVTGEYVTATIRTESVPAVAAEEVAKDTALQQKIEEKTGTIDVQEIIEAAPEKRAGQTAQEQAQVAEAEQTLAGQTAGLADTVSRDTSSGTDQVFETEAAPAEGSGGSTGGSSYAGAGAIGGSTGDGYSSSDTPSRPSTPTQPTKPDTPDTPDTPETPKVTVEVNDAKSLSENLAGSSKADIVSFTGTGTAENLSVPENKTLAIAEGASLTLTSGGESSSEIENRGTIENNGTLTITNASMSNLSANTVINNGTLIIKDGAFFNGGETAGRFVNKGTVRLEDKGAFINGENAGGSFVNNGTVEFASQEAWFDNRARGTLTGTEVTGEHVSLTVLFDANGGTPAEYSTERSVEYGGTINNLPEPTPPNGKAFAGWYRDKDGKTPWAQTDTVTWQKNGDVLGNLTLYAKYDPVTTPVEEQENVVQVTLRFPPESQALVDGIEERIASAVVVSGNAELLDGTPEVHYSQNADPNSTYVVAGDTATVRLRIKPTAGMDNATLELTEQSSAYVELKDKQADDKTAYFDRTYQYTVQE